MPTNSLFAVFVFAFVISFGAVIHLPYRSFIRNYSVCHCEERSDEAISTVAYMLKAGDCLAEPKALRYRRARNDIKKPFRE